ARARPARPPRSAQRPDRRRARRLLDLGRRLRAARRPRRLRGLRRHARGRPRRAAEVRGRRARAHPDRAGAAAGARPRAGERPPGCAVVCPAHLHRDALAAGAARVPGRCRESLVVMAAPPSEVIWHEVECGRYRADLPLWRELAAAGAPRGGHARVLDLGAGIGRVSLDLAAAGHRVTALDVSPALLEELARRARELPVETVVGDARDFRLDEDSFDLCLVPMQTLQLLRDEDERRALFASAAAHMRPGALLACAIVTAADEFDAMAGQLGPSPDRLAVGERVYFSR